MGLFGGCGLRLLCWLCRLCGCFWLFDGPRWQRGLGTGGCFVFEEVLQGRIEAVGGAGVAVTAAAPEPAHFEAMRFAIPRGWDSCNGQAGADSLRWWRRIPVARARLHFTWSRLRPLLRVRAPQTVNTTTCSTRRRPFIAHCTFYLYTRRSTFDVRL